MSKLIFLFSVVMTLGLAGKPVWATESKTEVATLAGGCFWCMFPPFAKQEGILKITAGYTGGTKENPSYDDVSSGTTGHVEAVEIVFNPQKLSYKKLIERFWGTMDPTDATGQFADRGTQYRSAIFYHSDEQKKIAEQSKAELEKSKRFNKPIVTKILPATRFWPAEEYHQDYYKKNPTHFWLYEKGSGREEFIKQHWGKTSTP